MTTTTNAAEQKKESGNPFDIFIEGTKYGDQILHPLRIDDPFNCFSHV